MMTIININTFRSNVKAKCNQSEKVVHDVNLVDSLIEAGSNFEMSLQYLCLAANFETLFDIK